jgi:hypothetical protein
MVQLESSGRLLALAEDLLYEVSNLVYLERDIAEYRENEDYAGVRELEDDREDAESAASELTTKLEAVLASPDLDVEEDSEELIAWVKDFLESQDESEDAIIARFYDYFPVDRG